MHSNDSCLLAANMPVSWLKTGYNLLTIIPAKQIVVDDIVFDIKYT